jgi:hypothetical protein
MDFFDVKPGMILFSGHSVTGKNVFYYIAFIDDKIGDEIKFHNVQVSNGSAKWYEPLLYGEILWNKSRGGDNTWLLEDETFHKIMKTIFYEITE